jgi:hypothetical protein
MLNFMSSEWSLQTVPKLMGLNMDSQASRGTEPVEPLSAGADADRYVPDFSNQRVRTRAVPIEPQSSAQQARAMVCEWAEFALQDKVGASCQDKLSQQTPSTKQLPMCGPLA